MPGPFTEADLLPISALQHLIYCPRQCALIHNEQFWSENRLTVQGQQLHEKTHDTQRGETRPGVRIARGLRLRSFRLGLVGQADVVEFPTQSTNDPATDPAAPGPPGPPAPPGLGGTHTSRTTTSTSTSTSASTSGAGGGGGGPVPIEYKRGRPKKHDADKVQLCAQALCLEEMLELPHRIPMGQLFYGKTRRRQDVALDETLRQRTRQTITNLHQLIGCGQTPRANYEANKCDRCSLYNLCMPKCLRPRRTASQIFLQTLAAALGDNP